MNQFGPVGRDGDEGETTRKSSRSSPRIASTRETPIMFNPERIQRRSRIRRAFVEQLDARIVPASVSLNPLAAAEFAQIRPADHGETAAAAISTIEVRREHRLMRIAERHLRCRAARAAARRARRSQMGS